jgi:hypothetical protein
MNNLVDWVVCLMVAATIYALAAVGIYRAIVAWL